MIENIRSISFSKEEQKFLGAVFMQLAKAAGAESPDLKLWAALYLKINKTADYKSDEIKLLLELTKTTLEAGQRVLDRTDNVEARVRASAAISAFNAIKGKLDNGIQQQPSPSTE